MSACKRVRMSRGEAVDRVCRLLLQDGETSAPQIAARAGVARSVVYSVCAELAETGEITERRVDGLRLLYRLVWQDSAELRPTVRACREHGIDVERVEWRGRQRLRAPHPSGAGLVWLDSPEDVELYAVDREAAGCVG